jgi:hypothetical protein
MYKNKEMANTSNTKFLGRIFQIQYELNFKVWRSFCGEWLERLHATCRRSDCQLLRIEGAVPRGQRDGSLRPYILGFLDRSRYFSIK